jgi:hypothetical protein
VEVPRERIAPLSIALATVTVPLSPTCIITVVAAMVVRGLSVVSWTTAKCPRIVVIAIARPDVRLPPVVITLAIVGGAAVPAIRGASVPLVIARVEIHIAARR